MKKLIILGIYFLIFFFLTPDLSIASNFITDYNVTYTVKPNTLTHVNFEISLTNKTSQYYASSYNIQVKIDDIINLQASDADGPIAPSIEKDPNGHNIELLFNKKVVGINNKLNFNLSFDTYKIAQKLGNTWEINIPRLVNKDQFNTFNTHVEVPNFLGKPDYVKPNIVEISGNKFTFTKEDLGNSEISIVYGSERVYKFNLNYHLENKNLFPVKTEIALPPNTNYQETQIDKIDPKPTDVIEDSDGNWLAKYYLSPSQKLDVLVEGKTKISLNPKKESLSSKKLQKYLAEQPYWEVSSKKIKDLAIALKTPYAIYEYVVRNLKYDYSKVSDKGMFKKQERLGGLKTLANKNSAVCLEFTDLFVTLARAAGIPAREVNGFAYTQNDRERPLSLVNDILHAWPEYYDKEQQAWIMVDPTWGNTTEGVDYFHVFDLDHFAFVIKGVNSRYPVPAGGYKIDSDKITKDVNVTFIEEFIEEEPKLTVTPFFSKSYVSGIPVKGSVSIVNVGRNLADPKEIEIFSKFLNPKSQKINLDKIPPYGKLFIPIEFDKTSFLTNVNTELTITLAGKSISENIKVSPLYINKLFLIGGITSAIGIITLSIIAIKSWNISFFRRKE